MPLRLYKWSTTAIKDKSASDPAQIPASALTIDVYRQGATVSAAVASIPGGGITSAVSVFEIGKLAVNDTLQVGTDSTKNLTVTAIASSVSITVRNDGGAAISLAKYDRLVLTSSRPSLYRDLTGTDVLSSSGQATTDSRGFVEFYLAQNQFDYIITNGSSLTLYRDEVAGSIAIGSTQANIQNFTTVQNAIDYVQRVGTGGTIYVPPGTYSPTSTPSFSGIVLPSWINLKGAHKDVSKFLLTSTSATHVTLTSTTAGVGGNTFEDLTFEGANSAGTGKGLDFYVPGKYTSGITMRNCVIIKTPSWGVDFFMDATGAFVDQVIFEEVAINFAKSGGSMRIGQDTVAGGNVMTFQKCQFNGPSFGTYGPDSLKVGVVHIAHSTNINFNGCSFQPLDCSPAMSFGSITRNVGLYNCLFETNTSQGTRNGHWFTVDSPTGISGLTVIGCSFTRFNTAMGIALIEVGNNSSTHGTLFANCFFHSNKTGAPATDDIQFGTSGNSKNFYLMNNALDYSILGASDMIPIANPIARMGWIQDGRIKFIGLTTAQRGALLAPKAGDVIYNTTTNLLNVYDGTSWKSVNVS